MEKSIFNKKRWLLSRSDLILSLKQDGMTNKQVIEHLKSAEKMPFDLDESLFSRHCKAILEQLDFKKSNATLTDKVQNLEKYTRYLESNNKNLILKNKELKKPKQQEPLRPVEPVNNEYIEHLKKQLSQKNQELKQYRNTLEQQEMTIRQLSNELERLPEETLNTALERKNMALKHDLSRLESLFADLGTNLSQTEEKLHTTQNRAKYSMYFAYCFAVLAIVLFLFIVL